MKSNRLISWIWQQNRKKMHAVSQGSSPHGHMPCLRHGALQGKDCVASIMNEVYSRILVHSNFFLKHFKTIPYYYHLIPTSRITIWDQKKGQNPQPVAHISEQNPRLRECSSLQSPRTSLCQPPAARQTDLPSEASLEMGENSHGGNLMFGMCGKGINTKCHNEMWTNTKFTKKCGSCWGKFVY